MKILKEFWDPDLHGAEVPSPITIRRWIKEDDWDGIILAYGQKNRPLIRQTLNTDITLMMPDMLRVIQEIAHDERPEAAKINTVRSAAARSLLQFGAVGILETRYGEPPDHDLDTREAVARVKGMTPEQIMALEAEELAEGDEDA